LRYGKSDVAPLPTDTRPRGAHSGKTWPDDAEPKPQLLARVNLAAGKREKNELYNAIPRRHTIGGPYDPRKSYLADFV